MAAISFPRTPYKISYYDLHGDKKTIRRVPPPKLHDILPEDEVEITRKKNDDFDAGDKLDVKSISPRSPNTLQIVNDDGQATFMSYLDLRISRRFAPDENGVTPLDQEESNQYLLWP